MTSEEWVSRARAFYVWDIGQLTKADRYALNRATKLGLVIKDRLLWCNIRLKTVWYALPTAPSRQ